MAVGRDSHSSQAPGEAVLKAQHHLRVTSGGTSAEPPQTVHNRWHPAILPALHIAPGELVRVETLDGVDGQITPKGGPDELLSVDTRRAHPLTGPIWIDGVKPGDYVEIEIIEVRTANFGVTPILPGVGFLGDLFDQPFVAKWHIKGGAATSRQIPGVTVSAAPFVGVLGLAPSLASLERYRAREDQVGRSGAKVFSPDSAEAIPSTGVAATDGLRTIPPREVGGNLDIQQLGPGSKLVIRAEVEGALLSLGDVHFAQGDGEVCGFAIETCGDVLIRPSLVTPERAPWQPRFPSVTTTESRRARDGDRRVLITTGLSLTDDGAVSDLDVNAAARQALREMLAYLTDARGLSDAQAYALASAVVDLRISSIVNLPTAVVSALLPLSVFDASD